MIKLKAVAGVDFLITKDGRICLKQDSFEYGKSVEIFITYEQFDYLQMFVQDFRSDILNILNVGVENE